MSYKKEIKLPCCGSRKEIEFISGIKVELFTCAACKGTYIVEQDNVKTEVFTGDEWLYDAIRLNNLMDEVLKSEGVVY